MTSYILPPYASFLSTINLSTCASQSNSHWHPYLALVLGNVHPGPPMLWAESERKRLLRGTGVEERVEQDLKRVEEDFTAAVLPFMQRHTHSFRYLSPRQSQP